jgi:hypothetical protein
MPDKRAPNIPPTKPEPAPAQPAANPMVSMMMGSQNVQDVNAAQNAIIQPAVRAGVSPAANVLRVSAPSGAGVPMTIAGNNFTPSDIEHLVTTAQEPPTQQDLEVEAELQRLAQAKARKA